MFPCPKSYAAALKDGMKATLDLPEYPDRKFDATILTTSHAIDQKSRTLLVELIADNKDGALSPGAFARVHFEIPPDPNAMRLPASALLFRDNALEVATVGLDNRIALKKVHIARDLGTEVEITGGLSQDERIVANPPNSIDDGEEVRVMEAAGEKTQGPAERQARRGPTTRRAPMRWRKQGGITGNELAAVARGADRACARRLRLCGATRVARSTAHLRRAALCWESAT